MGYLKQFTITVFLFNVLCVYANAQDGMREILPVKHAQRKTLTLSTFLDMPTHSVLISTGSGRIDQRQVDQRVQYNPTFGPNIGVRGVYDLWSLSLSQRPSFGSQNEVSIYGKSKYDDWRLGLHLTDSFVIEAYYQNYRGFYTDLTGQEGLQTSFGPTASEPSTLSAPVDSQIINRPDISSLNYGLRATHTLELTPIFSAFSTEKERETMNWDFNFLTKAYYNRMSIKGSRSLVPETTSNSFSPIASLKEYWSNTLGVGAGLGVVVPASPQVTFGFAALLGAGFQRQTNVYTESEQVGYTTAIEMNSSMYMDWKKEAHGFRFGLYFDTISSKVKDVNLDMSSLGLNLIYSYSGISL